MKTSEYETKETFSCNISLSFLFLCLLSSVSKTLYYATVRINQTYVVETVFGLEFVWNSFNQPEIYSLFLFATQLAHTSDKFQAENISKMYFKAYRNL